MGSPIVGSARASVNVPGGFAWLKFGATAQCTGYGLAMGPNNGCDPDAGFLNTEIGPPSNSFGCCDAVSGGPSTDANPIDRIGSLPGNKVSADCTYCIDNKVVVTVPVWDAAGGTGNNAYYQIVGFSGFEITGCPGAKNLTGVWRRAVFQGPTTSTPRFAGAPLAAQPIK